MSAPSACCSCSRYCYRPQLSRAYSVQASSVRRAPRLQSLRDNLPGCLDIRGIPGQQGFDVLQGLQERGCGRDEMRVGRLHGLGQVVAVPRVGDVVIPRLVVNDTGGVDRPGPGRVFWCACYSAAFLVLAAGVARGNTDSFVLNTFSISHFANGRTGIECLGPLCRVEITCERQASGNPQLRRRSGSPTPARATFRGESVRWVSDWQRRPGFKPGSFPIWISGKALSRKPVVRRPTAPAGLGRGVARGACADPA